jgi:hypothetical protein
MNPLLLLLASIVISHAAPSASPQPVAFRVGPLRFNRPESWCWVPPSGSFRAAQLEKMAPDGTVLTLTFSRFPSGNGGSVQANLDRWIAQFTTPSSSHPETKKGTDGSMTFIRLEGTLRGGTPGGPKKDLPHALLLGAILEADGEQVIMKLAGPVSAVATAEKEFLCLAETAIGLTP